MSRRNKADGHYELLKLIRDPYKQILFLTIVFFLNDIVILKKKKIVLAKSTKLMHHGQQPILTLNF